MNNFTLNIQAPLRHTALEAEGFFAKVQAALTDSEVRCWRSNDGLPCIRVEIDTTEDLLSVASGLLSLTSRLASEVDEPRLTKRETQMVRLLAEGMTEADVAKACECTTRTVNFHSANMRRKLGVTSRIGSLRKLLKRGTITLKDFLADEHVQQS